MSDRFGDPAADPTAQTGQIRVERLFTIVCGPLGSTRIPQPKSFRQRLKLNPPKGYLNPLPPLVKTIVASAFESHRLGQDPWGAWSFASFEFGRFPFASANFVAIAVTVFLSCSTFDATVRPFGPFGPTVDLGCDRNRDQKERKKFHFQIRGFEKNRV